MAWIDERTQRQTVEFQRWGCAELAQSVTFRLLSSSEGDAVRVSANSHVLITAGWVGDRIGHRTMFIVGMTLFTGASLACGLAPNEAWLAKARVVQGIGGGMLFTPVTALIQVMFTDRARGKASSVMGAVIGFATALGPLAGGLMKRGVTQDRVR